MRSARPGPLACVLGGMDIVSPLGRGGIACAVAVRPGDPARWSRHVVDVIDALDEWADPDAYVERLVDWAQRQSQPPVLYYPTDGHLVMVSRARAALTGPFRLVLPRAELVEDLVDKARFSALARRLGLRVPAADVLRHTADDPAGAHALRYPLVVKPVLHRDQHLLGYAGKAASAASPDELVALWRSARDAGADVLVQELVPGPETRIESYHAYVDADGVVAEFTGRKLSTRPRSFGETSLLEVVTIDDVREQGRRAVELLRLEGVCKIDFKRDGEGRLWLLEVNARFNLWHNPGAAAGVNLPALVHADLTGRPRPASGRTRDRVTWSDPSLLRRGVAAGELPRRALVQTVATTTRATGDWDDPWPLVRGLLLPKLPGARRLRADLGPCPPGRRP